MKSIKIMNIFYSPSVFYETMNTRVTCFFVVVVVVVS